MSTMVDESPRGSDVLSLRQQRRKQLTLFAPRRLHRPSLFPSSSSRALFRNRKRTNSELAALALSSAFTTTTTSSPATTRTTATIRPPSILNHTPRYTKKKKMINTTSILSIGFSPYPPSNSTSACSVVPFRNNPKPIVIQIPPLPTIKPRIVLPNTIKPRLLLPTINNNSNNNTNNNCSPCSSLSSSSSSEKNRRFDSSSLPMKKRLFIDLSSSSQEQQQQQRPNKRAKLQLPSLVSVRFHPKIYVKYIPSRDSYLECEKYKMWSSLKEISSNAKRNQLEYSYDGWKYQQASEEHKMHFDPHTGGYIHPVHHHLFKLAQAQQQQQKQKQQLFQQVKQKQKHKMQQQQKKDRYQHQHQHQKEQQQQQQQQLNNGNHSNSSTTTTTTTAKAADTAVRLPLQQSMVG